MTKGIGLLIDSLKAIIEETWNLNYEQETGECCDTFCFEAFNCQINRPLRPGQLIQDKKLMLAFMFYMLGFVKLELTR